MLVIKDIYSNSGVQGASWSSMYSARLPYDQKENDIGLGFWKQRLKWEFLCKWLTEDMLSGAGEWEKQNAARKNELSSGVWPHCGNQSVAFVCPVCLNCGTKNTTESKAVGLLQPYQPVIAMVCMCVCVRASEREREREREGERERERWDAVRQVIFLKPPEKWFLLAGQSFQITNKQKQKTELLIIALNPHSGHLVKEIWAGQQEPPLQQWFPWSSRSIACESWIANSRILAETYWIRSAGGGAWQLGTWIFQKILIYAQVGDPLPLPKTFKMGARKFKLLIKSEQKQQSVITGAKFLGLWENFMQLQAAS